MSYFIVITCSLVWTLVYYGDMQNGHDSTYFHQEFIPMKSLSCYNDYNSQVTCTWMEHSEAHALVGMILYHRRDIR
uniref:Cytokine receptor common subunit beta N-terminal domain-containing protein n=1 Tax=Athene cunicularia TaxID=194338 RepID=A0A663MHA8_ATHCN